MNWRRLGRATLSFVSFLGVLAGIAIAVAILPLWIQVAILLGVAAWISWHFAKGDE